MTCQPLEPRRLFAATYTYVNDVLTVHGSEASDQIKVSAFNMLAIAGLSLELNGKRIELFDGSHNVPLSQVVIHGGGGNDVIEVDQGNTVAGVRIRGEAGRDRILVTAAPYQSYTMIRGGDGDDWIGLAGNLIASVNGGRGDDVIRDESRLRPNYDISRAANFTLVGGAGHDLLIAGDGGGDRL